jgi:hypothetical protein
MPPERGEKLLHLGRRWLKGGELVSVLVHPAHFVVAPPLVVGERFVERAVPGETRVNGFSQQLGVAEGVADPLRGEGSLW